MAWRVLAITEVRSMPWAGYNGFHGATVQTAGPPAAARAAAAGAPPVFAGVGGSCRKMSSSKVQKSRVPVVL